MKLKKCSKCGEEKELDCFSKNKAGLLGLCSTCKNCVKKYYEENKKRIAKKGKKYREENKELISEKGKKYYKKNKELIAKKCKKYYEENKEYYAKKQKKYMKEYHQRVEYKKYQRLFMHNKRALLKKLKGTLTSAKWNQLLDLYNHVCPRCGKKTDLEMDHVVPVSWHEKYPDYVTNDIKNHQPLCRSCNASKQDRVVVRYLPANYFKNKIQLLAPSGHTIGCYNSR